MGLLDSNKCGGELLVLSYRSVTNGMAEVGLFVSSISGVDEGVYGRFAAPGISGGFCDCRTSLQDFLEDRLIENFDGDD
jgi:hypothetical protein